MNAMIRQSVRRLCVSVLRPACVLVALAVATSAGAQSGGFVPFPAYEGPKLPATAAVWTTVATEQFSRNEPYAVGYYLDTDGDAHADVAATSLLDHRMFGLQVILSSFVSPTNPDVVYLYGDPPAGTPPPFGHRVVRIERDGTGWRKAGGPYVLPPELQQVGLFFNTIAIKDFSQDWVQIVAVRNIDGKDALLAVRNIFNPDRDTFECRYALLVDSDGDAYADQFTPAASKMDLEAMTMDDRGHILGRTVPNKISPYATADAFFRIVDANGDGTPDEIDEDSRIPLPPFLESTASYTDGVASVDVGSDLLYVNQLNVTLLNSRHQPIADTNLQLNRLTFGVIPFRCYEIVVGHDGYPVAFADANLTEDDAVVVWGDFDFNRFMDNSEPPQSLEIRAVYFDQEFPQPFTRNMSQADLREIPTPSGGGTVTFRDEGVYPDGTSFRFRFGSKDFESVWIGRNGIVSFTGPVTGTASLDALAALRGAIAPAWSVEWDTSRVRVHAGYAPIQMSIRTGQPVKAFAVEWRGLRAPGWGDDQACSMRLLLYEDGAYRVDFGAMEADELGTMRFVTGYSGPGNHPSRLDVDASRHTWTFPASGTGQERVAGEEFTATKRSDIGHLWVRWMGYPERLDAAGPTPAIVNATRRNGKITLSVAGSNLVSGATLVVDLTETFTLTKKGAKWIVKKKTRSAPGNRTVAEIWADGQPHTIVVVNPDGEMSDAVSLP